MDVGSRLDRFRAGFDAAGIDALLVTRLPNVRYLAGFTGSAGMLLVTAADALFVTDGRYRDQASEQLAAAGVDARVAIGTTQAAQREVMSAAVADTGVGRLGLEAHGVTWAQQRAFADEWFPAVELLATTDLVESLRKLKDAGEVARIEAACAIADDTLAALLPTLADGPTERDFAIALEFGMRERGASGNSFDPIVASGPNGAKPHARPSTRAIERGELVVIDFGCIVDGYCSDMTRTVSVGDPGPDARRLYEVVLESQAAGSAAVGPGVVCADVDHASRAVIDAAGWGDAFVHGTGHGVGIEIHEAPRVSSISADTLAPGAVVTVEPGVYLTGIGGVRIEDTLVVVSSDDRASGNGGNGAGSRVLTNSPKDLVL
jgi:Xaa-Pro aminopeptidase